MEIGRIGEYGRTYNRLRTPKRICPYTRVCNCNTVTAPKF